MVPHCFCEFKKQAFMIIVSDFAPLSLSGCDVLACRPRRSDLQSGREMAPRNFAKTDKAGLFVDELSDSCFADCVRT